VRRPGVSSEGPQAMRALPRSRRGLELPMLARLALSGLALALVACRANDLRPAGVPIAPNLRVVDAETGQPVSGAEVFGVHEDTAPLSGELWYRASATTDDDGWAGLAPASDEREYSWRIVRAKGYATSGSTSVPRAGGEPEVVELHRAGEARLRVVDFLGRPVPNLKLGLCVGCGHTPDVAVAVTDEDGRATFACVGTRGRGIADVYPVGEGVQMDYLGVHWNAALDGGYEAVAFPGATLRGKLLLANGSPAVGYAVGAPARHRGPWTRTDDEGRFRLEGLLPRAYALASADPERRLAAAPTV